MPKHRITAVTADEETARAWRSWLSRKALPLWSEAGFDQERSLYHERLEWDGHARHLPALRLMVQARQISTYCRAALDGLSNAGPRAIQCLEMVKKRYRESDGTPGWVFSISPDGTPMDRTRDLYAHAFILFAYGWAFRLTGELAYRREARRTAEEIKDIFAATTAGYWDAVPAMDTFRRQNPHMHLFEAYLVLLEVTEDGFYLDQLKTLSSLLTDHMIDPSSGLLLEVFDVAWKPVWPSGQNRVEPGHLFEWSWLLAEYERVASLNPSEADRLRTIADRFLEVGLSRGCDLNRGYVIDAMNEEGLVFEATSRIWPQTELLRLLTRRRALGTDDLARFASGFLDRYAPERLGGGWIDRLDEAGAPLVDHMPASSLYHIYGAGRELVLRHGDVFPSGNSVDP